MDAAFANSMCAGCTFVIGDLTGGQWHECVPLAGVYRMRTEFCFENIGYSEAQ